MTIESDIAAFLRANAASDVFAAAHQANVTHAMVIHAETHVGDVQKSAFFAELVRRGAGATGGSAPRFHATERFDDTPRAQVQLQNYLFSAGRRHLTGPLAAYREMLDAASAVPGHRFAVFAANNPTVLDGDARHRGIFDAFLHSIQRHNTLHSLNTVSERTHGHFLLGAYHAGHQNVRTTVATTAQLLANRWAQVYVIRLYVDVVGGFRDGVIFGGEGDDVFERSGTTAISLLPIFRAHDAGRSFFAEIGGKSSVFSRLRAEDTATHAYDQTFDAILYLNESLTERYTVVRGDSLWSIAARKLGSGARWRELYEANREVVGDDPNLILPGQVLTIPRRPAEK